ncbi:phage tail protein [Micromonospora sp. NPDC003197]
MNEAIAAQAPKNLDEADKFGESGKADQVKGQVQGQVTDGKKASAEAIDTATKAPPDTSAAKDKPVTPLVADRPPGVPGTPDPGKAVPDKAPAAATDFSAGPAQVDQQMADAQVTEDQLAKSNEPEFTGALKEKKAGEQHAATAPGEVRAGEAQTLAGAKASAGAAGAAAMTALAADRKRAGQAVGEGKESAKGSDESKRAQVTAVLQKVFDATKKDVEGILTGLDKKVDDAFSKGEKAARDAFTADHKRRMDDYKDERYSGLVGKGRWIKDKFAGLPEEANQIFVAARKGYVDRMQQVISGVADIIGAELNRAKQRIATGRDQLQAEVKKLPAELQAIGKEAAGEFAGKFDELTESVDAKGKELVQTLASKYNEALKSVDEEIAAEKEKNKGLIAKAIDAVGGVIKTIMQLKDLLLGVLAKAASAIAGILKDPIGFLGNLVSAVGAGLKAFMANIGEHLKKGLIGWLLGSMAGAGLELPAKFDLRGIITMIASLLGLTWAALRARIVSRGVPEQAMTAVEASVPVAQKLQSEGVAGVTDEISQQVGDLKGNLLGKISEYLIPTVLIAGITWIISLLNPASAFIKACKMIIDIVTFIIERGAQIIEFVNAVLDAVIAIAGGGAGGVPALIENALAKSIPVLIGALAAILGIGGIANKVKSFFQTLTKPVRKAVDWITDKIVGIGKKIWAKLKGSGKKLKDKFGKKRAQQQDDSRPAADHDQRHRDLERAKRELPPQIERLLQSGIPASKLQATLTRWRLAYRLRVLTIRTDGNNSRVVAANSPEVDLVTRIVQSHGDFLSRLIRDLSQQVMDEPDVRRLAQQILDQRIAGGGSVQNPIENPEGYGGAPAALDLRNMSIAGPNKPGSRQVVPGIPGITAGQIKLGKQYPQEEQIKMSSATQGTTVGEVAASSLHPGNVVVVGPGKYSETAAAPPADPQLLMQAIFALQAGHEPPPGLSSTDLKRAAELARLAQVESGRGSGALVTENLANHLGTEGSLSWADRYGEEQPMVATGSGGISRRTQHQLGLPETPGVGSSFGKAKEADVAVFLGRELRLIARHLESQMLAQPELYDNQERLERYVLKHLRDHLKQILFFQARNHGANS